MSVHMQPSRIPQGESPEVLNKPVNGSETFEVGTVLKDVSGSWGEVTVDSDNGSLEAVSLEGAENGSPDSPADELTAALITDDTYFICEVWDSSAGSRVTDLSSLTVGDQGDLEVNNDIYRYDSNSNASAALEIVAVFPDHELVLVEFISSVVA